MVGGASMLKISDSNLAKKMISKVVGKVPDTLSDIVSFPDSASLLNMLINRNVIMVTIYYGRL